MADHSGHPAPTGNSSHNNAANPEGTNLSVAAASFVAANGSPFTSVDDMIPEGVRVVDPETTERTCTTTIHARMNIPVCAFEDNSEGRLLLIMSADPLCQMPLWMSRKITESTGDLKASYVSGGTTIATGAGSILWNEPQGSDAGTTSMCDSASWGQTWDRFGLSDMFAQTYELGQISMKHRIVGCAMRANVGVDTTLSRGSIEAGQFNWSDTRYIDPAAAYVPDAAQDSKAQAMWLANFREGNAFCGPATPVIQEFKEQKGIASLLKCNAYNVGERVIYSARTQDYGTLDADKGASVRWTDSNNFKFQKTYNRNIVLPDRQSYSNGVVTNIGAKTSSGGTLVLDPAANNGSNTYESGEIYAMNCNASRTDNDATNWKGVNYSAYANGASAGKLAYLKHTPTNDGWWTGTLLCAADTTQTIELTAGTQSYVSGGNVTYSAGDAGKEALGTQTFEPFFDKGMYINITGVAPTQWVNVEVVWHVEYQPKSWAMTRGIYPPVDLQFDMLASMLGDPKQFPIVVQGNSFFTSLWRGLKRAASTAVRIAGTAGNLISTYGGDLDPRLRLVGNALKEGASLYKRARNL